MECIKCRAYEANKESGLCDACEWEEMRRINGILYFPAFGILFNIFTGGIEFYGLIIELHTYVIKNNFLPYYPMGALALLTLVFLVSLYAAWSFFLRKKGTRNVMIIYYAIGLVTSLYLTVLPAIIFNIQLNFDSIKVLLSGVIGVIIWVPYFILSKRINIVFCR
ncbi:PF10754 family protein [Edwardsiella anguillarum]|uniref:DUF2569 domain-containing protein n=1 Tax=Edwardsiella TaxID=635 RepID=UPI00045D1746|nr:DUF2569 domain-containing protein [Edwardsiella anguillarum]AKM48617.1 hypothetical protein QY76_16090 [Edwardsiella sp. EA181011]GAJ67893.1 PF10754 family protein [Edwardsiella piscicida]RFS99760.1 DUF2569 domain-containing protein [Edwardsiella anguillarum]BET80046.1 PF10754 family protein [Edwardsiella anguillarum]BET83335.1 PF10754 family protein [Edwardsiella anguillarum]